MDKLHKLNQNMDELQKQIQLMKKARIAEHSFLHSGEYAIMKHVVQYQKMYGKSPTLVILSKRLEITQATVTPLVDRLVKKELLVKEVSETDKRAKLISLTDKGIALLRQNQSEQRERLYKVLDYLGEEDTIQLIRILEKVTTYFNQEE